MIIYFEKTALAKVGGEKGKVYEGLIMEPIFYLKFTAIF